MALDLEADVPLLEQDRLPLAAQERVWALGERLTGERFEVTQPATAPESLATGPRS